MGHGVSAAAGMTPDDVVAQAAGSTSTGRFSQPGEVAELVLFPPGDEAYGRVPFTPDPARRWPGAGARRSGSARCVRHAGGTGVVGVPPDHPGGQPSHRSM
ncbi:conserved hypothetical protein [Streptomyces sviceus ATCC 29083]|uniref:Uncharacterized protein n=1 Tax=Streptomyces sviceus (strain ATCC 29083 / DSM 924 / JCM 4929 / NBRC 13980 / NCIMB 11184 / NRRL 5439 / UC 5370) TaxID=463191 RepID=B5HY23_STRX2|nr:conserved hypothetical protein [Streptomyces sviceus ATCC 29083]